MNREHETWGLPLARLHDCTIAAQRGWWPTRQRTNSPPNAVEAWCILWDSSRRCSLTLTNGRWSVAAFPQHWTSMWAKWMKPSWSRLVGIEGVPIRGWTNTRSTHWGWRLPMGALNTSMPSLMVPPIARGWNPCGVHHEPAPCARCQRWNLWHRAQPLPCFGSKPFRTIPPLPRVFLKKYPNEDFDEL